MRSAPRSPTLPLIRLIAAVLFGVLLFSGPAYAAGTVSLKQRDPTEADGKWKLDMTVDYGGIPHLPHIPMVFTFTPTVLYERSLLDKTGDKPQLTRIPLQNQQPINESIDVGFADASGKVFKITKFDFVIRRDHGFEAGEYDLKITRSDDGVQMGQVIKLILKGDNPIVDRRAIVFAGEKPKKKKDDAEKKDDAAAGDKKDDKPAEDAAKDKPAEGDKPAEDAPGDANAPPAVPPKQGGCGCVVGGAAESPFAATAAVIGLGALLAARRRRRAA